MARAHCGRLVMIIEDDADVRESIVEVLTDHEYRLLEASNGDEGLEQLRAASEKPCVILLDLMMPVMDGWQFRAIQREDAALAAIPVVVLTAHANIAETVDRLAVHSCIKKPIQLGVLLAMIEELCRGDSSASGEA